MVVTNRIFFVIFMDLLVVSKKGIAEEDSFFDFFHETEYTGGTFTIPAKDLLYLYFLFMPLLYLNFLLRRKKKK